MAFFLSRMIRNVVIAFIVFNGIQYLLRWKTYNISPKEFRSMSSNIKVVDPASASNQFATAFRRAYPRAVNDDAPWLAVSIGGIDLKAMFLHSSLTEYVAIFGVPYAASGRIGMHWANSTCTVLTGTVNRLTDSTNVGNKESFSNGGNFRHGQFESFVYSMSDDTYVACYGRGVIPVSGVWAATGALARGEPLSLAQLFFTYSQGAYNQVAAGAIKMFNHYKDRATGGKGEL